MTYLSSAFEISRTKNEKFQDLNIPADSADSLCTANPPSCGKVKENSILLACKMVVGRFTDLLKETKEAS